MKAAYPESTISKRSGRFFEEDLALVIADLSSPENEVAYSVYPLHLLLEHRLVSKGDKLIRFGYGAIQNYLIARVVERWLTVSEKNEATRSALTLCSRNDSLLVKNVGRHLGRVLGNAWKTHLKRRWEETDPEDQRRAGIFALANVLASVQGKETRSEATTCLLSIVGDKKKRLFEDIYVRGRVAFLDLRSVRFENCSF